MPLKIDYYFIIRGRQVLTFEEAKAVNKKNKIKRNGYAQIKVGCPPPCLSLKIVNWAKSSTNGDKYSHLKKTEVACITKTIGHTKCHTRRKGCPLLVYLSKYFIRLY